MIKKDRAEALSSKSTLERHKANLSQMVMSHPRKQLPNVLNRESEDRNHSASSKTNIRSQVSGTRSQYFVDGFLSRQKMPETVERPKLEVSTGASKRTLEIQKS